MLLRALIGQNCSSTATQEMLFCVKTFLAGGATTLLRVELPVTSKPSALLTFFARCNKDPTLLHDLKFAVYVNV